MRNLTLITVIIGLFLFSCQKIEPEIASPDELSSLNYSEKIYAQPIIVNNQVISLGNDRSSTFLTAYNADGENVWRSSVDDYIIPGQNFDNISYVELKSNTDGNLLLNMIQYDDFSETIKSVRFSNQGDYMSDFTDTIHQTDTIFIQNDTIALPIESMFIGSGVVALSDGSIAVVSYWSPTVIDTTFVQMSIYNESGTHTGEQYYILPETVDVYSIFISKSNLLILESVNSQDNTKFYIINRGNHNVSVSDPLPIFGLNTFFENSKGEFIFTSGTFSANLDYYGLVVCINNQGEYLWHETYADNSAWIFMSTTETTDGYLFTGFNYNARLLGDIDWRITFNDKNVKAVVVKTDFRGKYKNDIGWSSILPIMESSVGAVVLNNEVISLFAGKYDRTIYSTIMLKLDDKGKILN